MTATQEQLARLRDCLTRLRGVVEDLERDHAANDEAKPQGEVEFDKPDKPPVID
ncbi:MAG: hypothetical protein RIA64_01840 [Rhodospirillales bacterium]